MIHDHTLGAVAAKYDMEIARGPQLTPPRSLADILSDPESTKPPAVVVPGLAWAGRITLVPAREGVGKSTLFAAVAAAVTRGADFLGELCARGNVLWVLVEEHLSDLVIRALRFQTAPDRFYILERPEMPLASLTAAVEQIRPDLVVIDTLHRFATVTGALKDAHAADSWGPLMTALDRMARTTDAAILMSAQATKSTGDYRDSTEIGHGVDVVLNLVRPEKLSPVRRLEVQKGRWSLEDVTFQLVGDRYERGGTVPRRLSPQRRKVLDALEPPMNFSEWRDASGVPETTFKRSLRYLLREGHVLRTPDETYELPEGPQGQVGATGPRGPEPVGRGHHHTAPIGAVVAPTAGPWPE